MNLIYAKKYVLMRTQRQKARTSLYNDNTHDGGGPAPTLQGAALITQPWEAPKWESAACGRDIQVVLVHQKGNAHPPLPLLPRVVKRDRAFPLTVLPPILKLKVNKSLNTLLQRGPSKKSWICKQTFLKMFMPISVERSGTAGLLRLVMDTLEKVSELRDLPSSLHFRVMSLRQREHDIEHQKTIQEVLKLRHSSVP